MFRGIGRWMMMGVMAMALQLFAGVASVSAGGTCPPGATYDPMPSIAPRPSIPPLKMSGSSYATAQAMAEWEPPANTFKLHSNTNATKTIYLDFTGHTGVWSVTTGYYRSYDFDGTFGSFSSQELAEIQKIWRAVSEDFLPFNVNVTTEEPPSGDLINSGGADVRWGRRVVISSTSEEYDFCWAYVGDFGANDNVELFVCAEGAGEGYWNSIAALISHEAGHSLGLNHDGQTPAIKYYEGHYAGSYYWTPIMGKQWNDTDPMIIYQWSKGEYAGASNNEDDLAIITTQNGFGYRADDHGSTTSSATPLVVDSATNVFVAEGIISHRTDLDYFVFTMSAVGIVEFYIDPEEFSPNLDILATLYNSAGTVIAVSNPTNDLNASFSTNLAAGTYYLSVDGTGYGTPQAGYSDYGSLGYYSIEASRMDLVLDCSPSGAGNVAFSWTGTGFKLQTRTNLVSGNWLDCLGGTISPISISMTNNRAFFRLAQ